MLRLKLCFCALSITATAIGVNAYNEKKQNLLEAKEQHQIMADLANTIDEVSSSIGEKIKEKEKIKKEKEEQAKKVLETQIKELEENRIIECENYLKEYSGYFNLDSERVIEIARNLTDNFDNGVIITVGDKQVVSNSNETLAMFLVWDLYKNSKDYSLTREELTISDEISHLNYDEEGNIILRNGLTFSQFMGKVGDCIEGDKCFDLAVSNFESNEQTNSQSIEKNNFGGWRHDGEYLTNVSPEAGVIQHCMSIEKLLDREYANLNEFSGIYTQNDKSKPNPDWVLHVSNKLVIVLANEDELFDYEEEKIYEKENHKVHKKMLAMNNFVNYPIS